MLVNFPFANMYPTKNIQMNSFNNRKSVSRLSSHSPNASKVGRTSRSTVGSTKLAWPDFAVITVNSALGISLVQYQAFEKGAPGPVENIQDFHYFSQCSGGIRPTDPYIGCTKPGLKAHKSLKRFFEFLSNDNNPSERATKMVAGEGTLVERLEAGGNGKLIVNYTSFCETKFKIQSRLSGVELEDVQFFSLHSSNLKAKDRIASFSSVHILSGICLFSRETLGGLTSRLGASQTRHSAPLPLDQRPTLYEIESLVRLPNAIADVVSALPTSLGVTITLDVPRAQYYAFLLDLYAEGHYNKKHLQCWLEIIDKRHSQIAEVFKKAIRDALRQRGVDRNNVAVELSTGLEGIIPYIRETINQGNFPSMENLLQELLVIDPSFREYYEHLPQSQHPPNIAHLGLDSYVCQVLRPVFQRVHETKYSGPQMKHIGRQLLINIDNPNERRIYSQAKEVLGRYQKEYSSLIDPLLLGIFPRELVFTAKNTGRSSLYSGNIGQQIYDTSEERIVSPGDVVESVYGEGVTRRVVDWMTEEGMFDISISSMLATPGLSSADSSDGENGVSE